MRGKSAVVQLYAVRPEEDFPFINPRKQSGNHICTIFALFYNLCKSPDMIHIGALFLDKEFL